MDWKKQLSSSSVISSGPGLPRPYEGTADGQPLGNPVPAPAMAEHLYPSYIERISMVDVDIKAPESRQNALGTQTSRVRRISG
ncbi:hypothetical protein FDG2_2466 [Candidatus Protofrankia californiensis]|uniref:Uncharacterized protein n=1 Tax=Candidatus Protofrankia californiensis TaxID=1839754 RepID=A0A1C3NXM7_9ACTN|nr:hypothetical protein FDG2_2466 [Candidatus Protofrankia californiensis]